MITFDLLKKFFSWVDIRPRKRVALSPSLDREFVTPKKHCRGHSSDTSLDEDTIEIDGDSDNEEVEIIEQFKSACNGTRLNSAHNNSRDASFKYYSARSSSTPKASSLCRSNLNMGHAQKNVKQTAVGRECRCPTLTKTHRLREKNQYEELLQNYLPQRIHVINEKPKESRPSSEVIDVIDLEKCSTTSSSSKPRQTSRIQELPSHSRWTPTNKLEIEAEIVTLDDGKKQKAVASESPRNEKPRANEVEITLVKPPQTKRVECVISNTLRDQLAAKDVMREDFIPQVVKRYNERIEKRYQEAEKLKQMTCVLAKSNRRVMEVALEQQLAQSMRLYETVLDEREEPEEAEEPLLPTLTNEMLKVVKNALIPRPHDEVLVEGFGLRITRKDIHTLADLNWLNDEVINFYMNLLIARGGNNSYPKVHAMNTFFYPKLTTGGHNSLKRWTRKIDIFAQDLVVVPIHLSIHWCMSIIDFRDKTIRYYDSMGSSNPKCLSALRQYLEDESLDKKKQRYDTSDWKLESVKDIPQQMNGSDCGVFSCMFAEFVCANRKITFTQEDMPYFRNKMVYEILKSKLL